MSTLPLASDTRDRLADRITSSAETALENPEQERTSRMVILGHLLDPKARVVASAISRLERTGRFSTIDRERIEDYITRALERSVLGMSKTPMGLADLLQAESPFAWSDRFAAACVQSGVTEVRRARLREVSVDMSELGEFEDGASYGSAAMGSAYGLQLSFGDRSLSAEELFIAQERHGLVSSVADAVAAWDEVPLSAYERATERARATRTLLGLPRAAVANDADKRWLSIELKRETAIDELRKSLAAHRDLASGIPQWDQLSVDDRLLDLWMDYTAEQATALLAAPAEAVLVIVQECAAFPPRPRDQRRVAIRRVVKNLTAAKGWASLVMRLEKAWVAEFFDARVGSYDYDSRTYEATEAVRIEDAQDWEAAADAVLHFPSSPLGAAVTTREDVCAWMMRAYRLISEPTLDAKAA